MSYLYISVRECAPPQLSPTQKTQSPAIERQLISAYHRQLAQQYTSLKYNFDMVSEVNSLLHERVVRDATDLTSKTVTLQMSNAVIVSLRKQLKASQKSDVKLQEKVNVRDAQKV